MKLALGFFAVVAPVEITHPVDEIEQRLSIGRRHAERSDC
jgi:hypothetical protein